MQSFDWQDLTITPEKRGAREFLKVSYPIRYGCYGEIGAGGYVFQFNRNGEIRFIERRSLGGFDHEGWLKRTLGNDWVFYSAGDYSGVYDLYGEYYVPSLPYPSNALVGRRLLEEEALGRALEGWRRLREEIRGSLPGGFGKEVEDFLGIVAAGDDQRLRDRADRLHRLIGGRLSVLPPDSRHVDYEVIPLVVVQGCAYHCGFCRVKSDQGLSVRTLREIDDEVEGLRAFLGPDLPNYNALFLGNHDALQARAEVLTHVAERAYHAFEFDRSYMKGAYLFLFGSVGSFLSAKDSLFETLNQLPYFTYVNIGMESVDPETLTVLRKPVAAEKVREAFTRMVEINQRHEKIEVSANFVFGEGLSERHFHSLVEMVSRNPRIPPGKGCLYLSPLVDGPLEEVRRRRALIRRFYTVKKASFLPVYLYLIQRL